MGGPIATTRPPPNPCGEPGRWSARSRPPIHRYDSGVARPPRSGQSRVHQPTPRPAHRSRRDRRQLMVQIMAGLIVVAMLLPVLAVFL